MKVNFNQTVKDFKGNSTDIVISDKLAELLFFAGNSDFHMTREEKWACLQDQSEIDCRRWNN